MALTDFIADFGEDIYYDPELRNVLEDHMTYFRENYCTPTIIDPGDAYQWRGDLFGLLAKLNCARKYHWFVMRLNQYTSPNQFTEDTVALLIPNLTQIQMIVQSHQSVSRIS